MKLTVSEAAALLHTTEGAVHRWAREGVIPCHLVQDQYWFHRDELLEWANTRGAGVAPAAFPETRRAGEAPAPPLARALEVGGVHGGIQAADRDAVIAAIVARTPIEEDSDRHLLFEVLRAREALGSTGIGEGIAIPHVRAPVVLAATEPSLTLLYLAQPVDFQAIDGRPVHTIFFMVTLTVRSHLQLLARLSAALHDARFRQAVLDRAPAATIVAEAHRIDLAVASGSSG